MNFKSLADATPHAASLIEGMRDFGHTLETAMADVIDNSITAGATTVHTDCQGSQAAPDLQGHLIFQAHLPSSAGFFRRRQEQLACLSGQDVL